MNDLIINETKPHEMQKRLKTRSRIYDLERSLHESIDAGEMPREDGNLTHYFTKGIYARELFIPAGTVMTSKLHKLPRLCIISQGDVTFITEYGMQRVQAPYTAVFKPGSKVALFTHADTVWTAIHGTDETDLDKLEENLIAKDHDEYDAYCKQLNIEIGGE